MKFTPRSFLALILLMSGVLVAHRAPGKEGVGVGPDLQGVERVVAVGDIHGDFENFTRLLMGAELIDEKLAWTGGKTVLIQTGDMLDRGPDSRQVMDLLLRLEKESRPAGGRVIVLLGNHEAFNLVGDLYYLHPRELAPYAGEETRTAREAGLQAVRVFLKKPKPLLRSDYYARLARELEGAGAEARFPSGYFRHQELFSRSGLYGKWLSSLPATFKIDRSLFLHAGISSRFGRRSFRALRQNVKEDLEAYFTVVDELVRLEVFHPLLGSPELGQLITAERSTGRVHPKLVPLIKKYLDLQRGPLFAEDGLVWYRGLANGSEVLLRRTVSSLLRAQDCDRIVIGHTQPLNHRILSRFNGGVILIDTGLNQEVYRGSIEALEILGGKKLKAITVDRRWNGGEDTESVTDPAFGLRFGGASSRLTARWIETASTAEAAAVTEAMKRSRTTVFNGGHSYALEGCAPARPP